MEDKNKEKLSKEMKKEVTNLFEKVLDYTQVACPNPETFKALRSRILRVGNDCIRNLNKNLKYYKIEFIPQTEDFIEVRQPKIIRKIKK